MALRECRLQIQGPLRLQARVWGLATICKFSVKSDQKLTSAEYETISNPKKFFKKGRVFKTPWSEPAGNVSTGQAAFVSSNDGQEWYTKPRRFVVVREESNFSLCLSLNTHKGQGMTKAGINTHDYAAVYAVGKEDKLTSEQKKMSKKPFPIVVEASDERVESTSHINLGRVYTVEHNSKVKKVGRIDSKHLGRLDDYFVDRIVKKGKSSTSMQYNQENAATANAMDSGYGQQPDPQYMRSNDNTTPDSGSSMYAPLAGQPASLPGYMSGSTADTTRDSGQYKVSYTVPANSSTYYQHSSSPQTTGDTRSGYEAAPPRSYYEQSPAPYYVAQSNQEAVQNSSYGNYTTSNYGYNSQGSSLPGSEGNFTNYEHTEAPSSTSVPNHQRHDERNPKDRTEKRYRR